MGPIQSVEDLLGLIRRRLWLIVLITVIGTILGVLVAKSRPATYAATAVLQVEMPLVTNSAPAAAAPLSAIQLLSSIEHRLTTRDNLLALISRHAVFPAGSAVPLDTQVMQMRQSLSFQNVTNQSGQLSALMITARAGEAEVAARLANDLAQSILDMGAEGHRATTEASFSFFKEQEARLWGEITTLEAQIATYREANRTALPGVNEARQTEIMQVETSLRSLEQERAALAAEQDQINALQITRATDRRRLEDITQRLSLIEAQAAPLTQRKSELEANMGDTAEVERVLSGYERQLRQMQEQYGIVSTKMAEAETAQDLASRQQTERFSLLERALTPPYPEGSGAKKIAIAGLVGSLGFGLALAFLLDMIKPVLRTSSQMERELGLRPIVAIPNAPLRRGAAGRARTATSISTLTQTDPS